MDADRFGLGARRDDAPFLVLLGDLDLVPCRRETTLFLGFLLGAGQLLALRRGVPAALEPA